MAHRRLSLIGVAVAVGAVAIAGWALYEYVLHPPVPAAQQCGLECGGPLLAFDKPTETTRGGDYWYNFTVGSAGGGVLLDDLDFDIQDAQGVNLTPQNWNLTVEGPVHGELAPVAYYNFASASWPLGGTTPLTAAQIIDLGTHQSLSDAGDQLGVIGVGAFQGSVWVAIP